MRILGAGGVGGVFVERRAAGEFDGRADFSADAALGERDGEAAFAAIVRAFHEAGADERMVDGGDGEKHGQGGLVGSGATVGKAKNRNTFLDGGGGLIG